MPRRRKDQQEPDSEGKALSNALGPQYFDQLPEGTTTEELREIVLRSAQKGALWAVQQLKHIAQYGTKDDVVRVHALRLLLEVGRLYAKAAPLPITFASSVTPTHPTRIKAGNVLVIDSAKAEAILRQKRIGVATGVGHGPIESGAPAAEDPPASAQNDSADRPETKSEQTKAGIARARAAREAEEAFWGKLVSDQRELPPGFLANRDLPSPGPQGAAPAADAAVVPGGEEEAEEDRREPPVETDKNEAY